MRIYFMGICGTAMGNAALLLKEQGHDVFGADAGIYPPMSDVLADAGIEVFDGFTDRNLLLGGASCRGKASIDQLLICYRSDTLVRSTSS